MLTKKAKLIIILLGLGLIFAWYTQFEFIYFISAILASIILLSYLLFLLTLININCIRKIPEAVYEDEIIKVEITLENRSIFDNYLLLIIDNFPADTIYQQTKKAVFAHLPRRSTIIWTYEGLCFKRGVYWVGPLTLTASDPLGIFKKNKTFNIISRLTVYPRIFNIRYLPPFMKGIVTPRYGLRTTRRSGEYEEFYGIREYRREDGLRKIHWPSSARHNELIVRHFEQSAIDAVSIILDLNQKNNLGSAKETTLEYAVTIAASLSKYFLDQGSIVQFLAYEDKLLMSSLGQSPSHFFTILELLAKVEPKSYYSLEKAITLLSAFVPSTSTLVIIRLDTDLEATRILEQLIYTKNIALIEIQLISSSFDKYAPESPKYHIQIKASDIQTYKVRCGMKLETAFNPV